LLRIFPSSWFSIVAKINSNDFKFIDFKYKLLKNT
jgi:hypothetical protein